MKYCWNSHWLIHAKRARGLSLHHLKVVMLSLDMQCEDCEGTVRL
jgi:hypothetical protein